MCYSSGKITVKLYLLVIYLIIHCNKCDSCTAFKLIHSNLICQWKNNDYDVLSRTFTVKGIKRNRRIIFCSDDGYLL